MGAEKLKDTGYGGLPVRTRGTTFDMIGVTGSAPGHFAQLASAYRRAHGVGKDDLKRAMAPVSVKSHPRSEEHTSELQSLMRISYAVFCLKKKYTLIPFTPSHTYNIT